MNKWFVMAIGLLLGGSIVSCKDNDLIPEQNTKQEQTASGKMREEKIYGDFSATLPVPKSDKALTLVDNGGTGGAQTGHPLIDWSAMFESLKERKIIIMHCAIRNDAYDCSGQGVTNHLFYMDVPCEMKKSGDGYKLMFNEETLPVYTPSENTSKIGDSNNNKWELQALCFMGNEPGNAPKVDHRGEHDFSLEAQNVAAGKDEPFHLSIPLYSDWTPVKLRMQGGTPRLSVSLALKPYGTILALPINITSNLYFPFAVQCHVRSNAFTLKGAIKLGLLTADSKRTTMKGLPPVFEDVNQGKTTDLDPEGQQQDGYADYVFHCADGKGNLYESRKPDDNSEEGQSMKNKYIYTWVLPCKKNKTQKDDLTVKIGCGTLSSYYRDANGDYHPEIYNETSNDNGKKVYDEIGDPFHYVATSSFAPSVFAEGRTLKLGKKPISADIQSDMMITEVLNYELIKGFSWGYNYSMVELTNPTNVPLDLTDYKLIRERDMGTDSKGAYASYHPSENGGIARNKGGVTTDIGKAAAQDIYFKNADTKDVKHTQKRGETKQDNPNPLSPVYSADMKSMYSDVPNTNGFTFVGGVSMINNAQYMEIAKKYRMSLSGSSVASGNFTVKEKYLYPGNSILIIATAYLNHDSGWAYSDVLSPYANSALDDGTCQYILAVNDGVKINSYRARRVESGVMDLGKNHVIILMKKNESGAFTPLDTSGPMIYTDNGKGIAKDSYYQGYRNLVYDKIPDIKFLLTRKDWVMKPSLNFNSIEGNSTGTGGGSSSYDWSDKGGWIISYGKNNAAVVSSVASPGTRFVNDLYRSKPEYQSFRIENPGATIKGVIPK